MPLINRANLISVLYLENNLTPHVFTPARMTVLKLLASQAAISLENARLYRDAQQMAAYLKAAQTLSLTGSFGWRPATGAINWSEETYQIMGCDRETKPTLELVFQRIHPEDTDVVQRAIDRAMRDGTDLDFEHRLRLPDGAIKSVYILAHAVLDESRSIEYVGAIMDITERKRAEEAMRSAQADLARAARLTTMGELTTSIAHEINQPLGAVVNNASACLRWLAAQNLEEARRSLAMVIADGHRAAEIIGRIRALAQKAPPRKDWLDLNDTIRDVLALAQGELQAHRVLVRAQLDGGLPMILGDRIQLQQVLLNLIVNALEAMSGGGDGPCELVVRSARDPANGVLVSVQRFRAGAGPDESGSAVRALPYDQGAGTRPGAGDQSPDPRGARRTALGHGERAPWSRRFSSRCRSARRAGHDRCRRDGLRRRRRCDDAALAGEPHPLRRAPRRRVRLRAGVPAQRPPGRSPAALCWMCACRA